MKKLKTRMQEEELVIGITDKSKKFFATTLDEKLSSILKVTKK